MENNNAYTNTPKEQSETQDKPTIGDKKRALLAVKGILEVTHAKRAVSAAVESVIERIESEGIKDIQIGDSVFVDMCASALYESTKEPKLNPERLLYGVFKVLIAYYVCQRDNNKEAK